MVSSTEGLNGEEGGPHFRSLSVVGKSQLTNKYKRFLRECLCKSGPVDFA